MFYRIEEGEWPHYGFNYEKTINGHALTLFVWLPYRWRLRIGYYWGVNFSRIFEFERWPMKRSEIEGKLEDLFAPLVGPFIKKYCLDDFGNIYYDRVEEIVLRNSSPADKRFSLAILYRFASRQTSREMYKENYGMFS